MNTQPTDDRRLQPADRAKPRSARSRFSCFLQPRRRGAAAIEFAIVAPVFFMLIFGMFEFGRMLMVQQVLTNAARSGARIAVIDGASSAEVISTIQEYLDNASIDPQDVTISVNPSNLSQTDTGDAITVSLSVPFTDVSWLPSPWFLSNRTLQASCTMRRE